MSFSLPILKILGLLCLSYIEQGDLPPLMTLILSFLLQEDFPDAALAKLETLHMCVCVCYYFLGLPG